ncbi:MAG: FG-GAP-like repeat-containing protein, partial [Flavitalea sp.]
DLDNDGDLDLVINNINEEAFIYRNNTRERNLNNYLGIRLAGKKKDVGIGASVLIYVKGQLQRQEVNPNRGYLSCVSTVLNFGTGKSEVVDSVVVNWPDGNIQRFVNVKTNQQFNIAYTVAGTAPRNKPLRVLPSWPVEAIAPLFTKAENILTYKHADVQENDFKRQPLMLFMYSKTGPVMAKADIDKDGLEDLYISGDLENPGFVYRQNEYGKLVKWDTAGFGTDAESCVSAALFFDANGDGAPDLYLARGGYSLFEPNTITLQDQLYLNDGKGGFTLSRGALPNMSASSKSVIRACDYDGDGDPDLFVGGRVIPGMYPVAPQSYLLKNNGKGMFLQVSTPFDKAGMITDAAWLDLNNDGRKDLIFCGEFLPVTVYINSKEGFVEKTKDYFPVSDPGFWNTLKVADLNGDGLEDLVVGNLGSNTQIKASATEPADLYYADFDKNGSIDPFFNFYLGGKSYPFVSRDELNDQIYPMRRKFASYKDYSAATMKEIFSAEDLANATHLQVTETRSVVYLRKGKVFEKQLLPPAAQFSMISRIETGDFNKDGKIDLLLTGNHSDNRLKIGSIDANYGCVLLGDGSGNFKYVDQVQSGLSVAGDVKSMLTIKVKNENIIVAAAGDHPLQFIKTK